MTASSLISEKNSKDFLSPALENDPVRDFDLYIVNLISCGSPPHITIELPVVLHLSSLTRD